MVEQGSMIFTEIVFLGRWKSIIHHLLLSKNLPIHSLLGIPFFLRRAVIDQKGVHDALGKLITVNLRRWGRKYLTSYEKTLEAVYFFLNFSRGKISPQCTPGVRLSKNDGEFAKNYIEIPKSRNLERFRRGWSSFMHGLSRFPSISN